MVVRESPRVYQKLNEVWEEDFRKNMPDWPAGIWQYGSDVFRNVEKGHSWDVIPRISDEFNVIF